MPKELFNQVLVDEPAGSDRMALSVPGASGGKNILYSKFKDIMRAGTADFWAAGVINKAPAIRQVGDELFLLRESVVLPFDSQVSPELDDINWVRMGEYQWDIVHIDSAVTTSFNAVKNTHYIVDCTAAPVTGILPNAETGNVDDFSFILAVDTHKLTITTQGGTQLIGQHTSLIIPTIGGGVMIKADSDHYGVTSDTRQLTTIVPITSNRDFSADGFENNIIYQIKPNGGEITISLPTAYQLSDDIVIRSRFEQVGEGRVSIGAATGTIGGETSIVFNAHGQGIDIIWAGLVYSTSGDTRPKQLTASFVSYPVAELSTITDPLRSSFFAQRVSSIEDPRFDKVTAVETSVVITANPTDAWQLIASSITDAGVLIGEIGEGAINILVNLRRTGLNVNAYFEYYKRTDAGVETLIAASSVVPVTGDTYVQYTASAIHALFSMTSTDRIVVRTYARKSTTGSNPTLFVNAEGINPTRSTLEVSAGTIAHNTLAGRELAGAHTGEAISIDASGFDGNLDSSVNTVQKLAQAVDDLVAGGGGVTVHNDLTGRDEDDSHPIGAITGLENRLAGIENQQSGNQLTFASIYGYYNFI